MAEIDQPRHRKYNNDWEFLTKPAQSGLAMYWFGRAAPLAVMLVFVYLLPSFSLR
jgi:hypothetical protein